LRYNLTLQCGCAAEAQRIELWHVQERPSYCIAAGVQPLNGLVLQITSRQKLVRRSDNGTNLLFLPNEQRRDVNDQRAEPLEQLPEVKYSEYRMEGVLGRVPERVPERVQERVPERVPERVQERVQARVQERVPEREYLKSSNDYEMPLLWSARTKSRMLKSTLIKGVLWRCCVEEKPRAFG
jgi:hypothetical protein